MHIHIYIYMYIYTYCLLDVLYVVAYTCVIVSCCCLFLTGRVPVIKIWLAYN